MKINPLDTTSPLTNATTVQTTNNRQSTERPNVIYSRTIDAVVKKCLDDYKSTLQIEPQSTLPLETHLRTTSPDELIQKITVGLLTALSDLKVEMGGKAGELFFSPHQTQDTEEDFVELIVPPELSDAVQDYIDPYHIALVTGDTNSVINNLRQEKQLPALLAFIALATVNLLNGEGHDEILAECDEIMSDSLKQSYPTGLTQEAISFYKPLYSAIQILESADLKVNRASFGLESTANTLVELAIIGSPTPILANIDTHTNMKAFLSQYGHRLLAITTPLLQSLDKPEDIFELLPYFKKLRTVNLSHSTSALLPLCESIKCLVITSSPWINDEVLKKQDLAKSTPHLYRLNLSGTEASLKDIILPKTLTELVLNDCPNLDDAALTSILTQCTTLKKLSIARTKVEFSVVHKLPSSLETLCLDGLKIQSTNLSSSFPKPLKLHMLSLNQALFDASTLVIPPSTIKLELVGISITDSVPCAVQQQVPVTQLPAAQSPVTQTTIHLPVIPPKDKKDDTDDVAE